MEHSAADVRLLFATRVARMSAFGAVSVALPLYLAAAGLDGRQIGILLTLTLIGDAAVSLGITTRADRLGRRRMLVVGAALMAAGGLVCAITRDPRWLALGVIFGVLSPSGNEIGPFLSIEQAALSQVVGDGRRTRVLAWYYLVGSVATACGALGAGALSRVLQHAGTSPLGAYRVLLLGYAATGVGLGLAFARLSRQVEPSGPPADGAGAWLGLGSSRGVVARLASLFALDAFGGGFVVQSILVYWLHVHRGIDEGVLGAVFFAANLLAGLSGLAAVRLAARWGLVNTMVFTHLPSNVMLALVPFMPGAGGAVGMLLARYAISQMDVPTRHSYLMAVVAPHERSAAAGVAALARSVGAAVSPAIAGWMLARPSWVAAPFVVAGSLKATYDLLLWRAFRHRRAPEERKAGG